MPEAFKVLTKELMDLGMDVELFGKDGKVIDMDSLARQTQQEEQRSMRAVRNIGNENSSTEKNSEVYDDVDVLDTQVADELFN